MFTVTNDILRTVVQFVKQGDRGQLLALDIFPAALYATDADGVITYFNPACIGFAGRRPSVGRDRWCVTWKLYTNDGDFLPHDQCPMAVAIQTGKPVRGATAVAERPNGTRVNFMPFPTPVIGGDGKLLGAVNVLLDIGDRGCFALRDFDDDLRAWRSLLVESALANFTLEEIRNLTGEIEAELRRHVLH
jgi:PAS domain-containing protein